MRARLVPRAEWFRFFEEFGRRDEGWLVTGAGSIRASALRSRPATLPREGAVASADATGPISLQLGGSTRSNIEHQIASPRQVWVEISESGIEEALGVLSDDGTKTIVEFRSPALPETVDGIVHP